MNKSLVRLIFAASAVVGLSACAHFPHGDSNILDANTPSIHSDWVHDRNGTDAVVHGGFGTCWGTGFQSGDHDENNCPSEPAPAAAYVPPPAPAYTPPAPVPAAAPTTQKVSLAADTLFDFDRANLRPDGKEALDDLVAKLHNMDLEVIVAVGHTDSVGSAEYNQKLSIRRAESVKAYLVGKGIPADRIYTEGKGKSQPIADNSTRAGRAQNRRVEIELVGTTATH